MNAVVRILVAGYLFVALVACSSSLDRAALQSLSADAKTLLETVRVDTSGDVTPPHWPQTIRSLQPRRVYVGSEGLYIVTGSFFVEEWGYFVPADKAVFSPFAAGDPSYKSLGYDVYWYEIKG